jgi:hypothetical protein
MKPDKNHPAPAGKTLPYSDLDLTQWRDYPDVETDSLWLINSRERGHGHALEYHGNCVPQIVTQLLTRFTRQEDILLDLFLGSGTSAIEAVHLGRRAVGVELQADVAAKVSDKLGELGASDRALVIAGDSSQGIWTGRAISRALGQLNAEHAQFLLLHPPYAGIIRFSEHQRCLSNAADIPAFLDQFEAVARLGWEFLEPGRFAGLVIGDCYTGGEWVPLGFYCLERMNRIGFKTKSIVVKNMTGNEKAKGKNANLWRYRALRGGFYVFKHEYVMLLQKPKL